MSNDPGTGEQPSVGLTFTWHVEDYSGDDRVAVLDDHGWDIAHVPLYVRETHPNAPTVAEQHARAALIAAAPGLRNALQLAIPHMPPGADRDQAQAALDATIRVRVAPRGEDAFEDTLAAFLGYNDDVDDMAEWARTARPGMVERFFGYVGHYFDVTLITGSRS